MIVHSKIEFYPLWVNENPELYKKHRETFFKEAKENGLEKIKEYWQFGLFYIEASK